MNGEKLMPGPIGDRPCLTDAVEADLEKRFTHHPPKGDQVARYQHLRDAGRQLARNIVFHTPAGREQALALTNLEQALFWANAAIARNE